MNLKTEDNNSNMYVDTDVNYQNEFGTYDDLQGNDIMNQFDDTPYVSKVEEPKKKNLKDFILTILGILMFVGIALWCLVSGIKAMFLAPVPPMEEAFTNLVEGDVYEGTITCISTEIGELKHTINFIPAGTEHFYLMVSEDGNTIIPIRASKEWDDLYGGNAWQEVSLQERGIVREMDYKVRNELMSDLATVFSTEGIQFESNYYLDLNANKMGGLQIFAGLALLLCIVYFIVVSKRTDEDVKSFKTPVAGAILVLGFASLAVIIYLLNMVGF